MEVVRHGIVIKPDMLPGGDGSNINGPSVIRVPDWIEDAMGKYYMYFAHHSGKYMRLAYADDPLGPWSVHGPGSLALEDCPVVRDHIASPDVHVDEDGGQIVMFFHGPAKAVKGQKSFAAVSHDGIDFIPLPDVLGFFYFRVWRHGDWWYALGKSRLYRSRDMLIGYEPSHVVLEVDGTVTADMNEAGNIRHTAVVADGDTLTVYYTKQADAPERILCGTIDMSQPWTDWRITGERLVIEPVEPWEGAGLPVEPSGPGACMTPVNELRDPCILRDEGRTYLYYCVAGEQAIAVAELR